MKKRNQYATIVPSSPIFVSFELTYSCNNNCEYCYNYWRNNKDYALPILEESKLEEKKKVLDELKDNDVLMINFTGGEPTLSLDLLELVSYSTEMGLVPTLTTNGRLITENIAKKLKDAGLTGVLVSLSGSTAQKHDAQTQIRGSWAETIRGIKMLRKFGVPVTVSFTITRKNYTDFENIALLCKSLGVNFSAGRFIPPLPEKEYIELELCAKEIDLIFKTIKKLNLRGSFETPIPLCILDGCYNYFDPCQCSAGIIFCVISPDLTVRPCPINYDHFAGNLRYSTFKEIWQSKEMKLWRDSSPEECLSCSCFVLCRGGCKQAAIVHHGHISALDPLARPPCQITQSSTVHFSDKFYENLIHSIPKICKRYKKIRKENFGATVLFEDGSYIFLIGNVSIDVWNLIDGKREVLDIICLISSKYKEDEKNVEKDVLNFFNQLISYGVVGLGKNESR